MMEQKRDILKGKLQLPVGLSDWAIISREYYCVDKTLFIKELVDRKTHVALFTRPRRFGKTSAMEMVRAFFEKTAEDTSYLFKDKKIWAAGEDYRKLQGKFPVITLSFKDHKADTWEDAAEKLKGDICEEVTRHQECVLSNWKDPIGQERLSRILYGKATIEEYSGAVKLLSKALHVVYGEKPIILIDEYDQPIMSASANGYYDKMVGFMRVFLSGALKDNKHCQMGLLTGVLRVAKEGIFSGLNNLKVWSIFESDFSEYFGFTEEEVRAMAEYYEVPEKMEEIREWYDGYNFGGREMYNPWSVINYFDSKCLPEAYWVDTSSNDLVLEMLRTYPHDFADTIQALLKGESPWVGMVKELGPYADVLKQPETLYALLVSTGYLKTASTMDRGICAVCLPNREIAQVFESEIRMRLPAPTKRPAKEIGYAIRMMDPDALQKAIASFLRESVSYYDTVNESFYHGLTLGFLAMVRDQFRVDSNGESGEGRFDIALTPRNTTYPGFVIEIKTADSEGEDLDDLAKTALKQIQTKDYGAKMERDMQALGSTQGIVKMGLAYYKKKVVLVEG